MKKAFNNETKEERIIVSFKPNPVIIVISIFSGLLFFFLIAAWDASEKPQFYHVPGWSGLLFALVFFSFFMGFFMQYITITEDTVIVEAVYSKLLRHTFRTKIKFNEIISLVRVDTWNAGRFLEIKTVSQVLCISYWLIKSSDFEKLVNIILSKVKQEIREQYQGHEDTWLKN